MANCPDIVVWNPIPAGSVLKARSSGTDDYDATVDVSFDDGTAWFWAKADLDPGAAERAMPHVSGAARPAMTINHGSATVDLWVESNGTRIHQCTWTFSDADSPRFMVVDLVRG